MIISKYPSKEEWPFLLKRSIDDLTSKADTLKQVLNDVQTERDAAVKRYEKLFDNVVLDNLQVSQEEIEEAESLLHEELKIAIQTAKTNIEKFHLAQRFEGQKIETTPGVVCWQKAVPIEKVGLYIPGGTAPLFSTVLMLAVPARIAGCKEIVLCTPPDKKGKVPAPILYAARLAGVNKMFKIGGSQAIAAMAFGTESVPNVYKIFGPGNFYVTAAKQLVSMRGVAIDMPAGPSEVAIIADQTANPRFIAADFLSQAEHGVDSQSILLTASELLASQVAEEIQKQLHVLPRKEIAGKALENSRIIVLANDDEIIEFTNHYAPEHLIIQTANYTELSEQIVNAGSVFLGPYTPESAGDYASGTNHTLPTHGFAKSYSGVNLDSFIKKITFQEISSEGLSRLGKTIEVMAEHELLDAHKRAVSIRLEK